MSQELPENIQAALMIEGIKGAVHMQRELLIPAPAVAMLHRVVEESDYRAVAMDTWRDIFVMRGESYEILLSFLKQSGGNGEAVSSLFRTLENWE